MSSLTLPQSLIQEDLPQIDTLLESSPFVKASSIARMVMDDTHFQVLPKLPFNKLLAFKNNLIPQTTSLSKNIFLSEHKTFRRHDLT